MIKKNDFFNNNRVTRIILLAFTIGFFIIFFFLFNSSYEQYQNIQQRTNNLLKLAEENQDDIDSLYDTFNETEHYFRLFSINSNIEDYNQFKSNLIELRRIVDTLIFEERGDIIYDPIGLINKEQHEKLLSHYLSIKVLLDSVTTYSEGLISPDENTIETQVFETDQTNSITASNFKSSLSRLSKKYQELLANNFNILYRIDATTRDLNEEQSTITKEIVSRESQELTIQSNEFRSQIFLSLNFMFILICIIIYYQFFTVYYERKLVSEKKYANKLAEEKSDIFAQITHEIRTPINSLIGILDLLKKKKDLYNEKDRLLVESAYTSITNTSKTINDILNLSKKENLESQYEDFDIENLVQDIIDVHQSQAKIKNLVLKYTLGRNTPTIISTDEFKVRQIITNLISNAIKYSNTGEINCMIIIDAFSRLIIKVKDQGIGIPFDMQQNLFKKYFTAESDNRYSNGIGLGLYITKRFTESLNGEISFSSSAETGSIFNVNIPIQSAKYKEVEFLKYQTISDLPEELSWLIVDDNALNLLYLKQFFNRFSKVELANNGYEAFEIIKQKRIDIVITDINMPFISGDELLLKIRKVPEYNHIKIIATSSDNEQIKKLEIIHNCYFDGKLIKPFNEKDLIKTIIKSLNLD